MQAAIPQELSALMALEQGMRQGTVSPVTPQGTPTVAAQMANAAQQQMMPQPQMPPQGMPGMQDVAQQAGLGAQIQAMQQQQAQQQAMNPQAIAEMAAQMMQQQMGRGIAAAPGAGAVRMADGGIVGYAEGSTKKPLKDEDSEEKKPRFSQFVEDVLSLPERYEKHQQEVRAEDARKAAAEAAAAAQRKAVEEEQSKGSFFNYLFGTKPYVPPAPPAVMDSRRAMAAEAARFAQDVPYQPGGKPVVETPAAAAAAAPSPRPPAPPRPAVAAAPAAPAQGGIASVLPGSAADLRRQALEGIEKITTAQPTPEAISTAAQQQAAARRAFETSQGLDPDYLRKQQEDADRRLKERLGYTEEQMADIKRREQELAQRRAGVGGVPQSVIDFLLNAQGFKGQGLGQVFRSGVAGLQAGESAARAEQAKMREEGARLREMRFGYEDASVREKQALQNARHATAMGDWNTANASVMEAQKAQNQKYVLKAEIQGKFAHDIAQEEMNRERIKAEYAKMGADKDYQRLSAAQQRVDSAMVLRQKTYDNVKQFLMLPKEVREKDPMMKQMYDSAMDELARIDRDVLEPAKQNRDMLQQKVLGMAPTKAPAASGSKVMTEADVVTTAKKSGKSELEVREAAKAAGYTIK